MPKYNIPYKDYRRGGGAIIRQPFNRQDTLPWIKNPKKIKIKILHNISEKNRNFLREDLRKIQSKLYQVMPDTFFNSVIRCINNEEFELDSNVKKYIIELTSLKKPDIWPEKIFYFLKDTMRNEIIAKKI